MQSNRIKNIEFLRVLGCIAVMIYHLFTNRLNGLFPNIDLYKTFHNYTLINAPTH